MENGKDYIISLTAQGAWHMVTFLPVSAFTPFTMCLLLSSKPSHKLQFEF